MMTLFGTVSVREGFIYGVDMMPLISRSSATKLDCFIFSLMRGNTCLKFNRVIFILILYSKFERSFIIKLRMNYVRKVFDTYPSTTKVIISGVLFSLSDYLTQIGKTLLMQHSKKYPSIPKEILSS